MIKYSLKCIEDDCNKKDPFDGWFQNSASFEKQIKAGLHFMSLLWKFKNKKNLMSPSVKTDKEIKSKINSNFKYEKLSGKTSRQVDMMVVLEILKKKSKKMQSLLGRTLQRSKSYSRREIKERAIYGQANAKDLEELKSKNIDIIDIPWVQEDN